MRKLCLSLLVLLFAASCGEGGQPSSREGGEASSCDDSVQYTYWDNGKLKSELRYADGQLNGECRWYYENGQLFKDGQYANGMMDGSWLVFYPDGSLAARAQYDKGKGKQTGYNEEGCVIFEVTYLDNVKHGTETRYAPDGRVLQVIEYQHGEKVEPQE